MGLEVVYFDFLDMFNNFFKKEKKEIRDLEVVYNFSQ